MALSGVAMECGDGAKFLGNAGCNVLAYTTIGADTRFRGPQFTLFYRFKLTSSSFTAGNGVVGCADSSGLTIKRFALLISVNGANLELKGRINSTACGAILTTFHAVAKDTNEHSVAWTYDQNADYAAYWDGVQVDTGPATCSDINLPAAASDIFMIHGNDLFDGSDLFNIDRVMFSDSYAMASQIATIDANCGSF